MSKRELKKQEINKENTKKKTKKKHKIIRRFFLIILLILLIGGGIFVYKVNKNGGGLAGIITTVVGGNSDDISQLEDIYMLCMGKSQNLTDTIMVMKYSPKLQQAQLLSIPRDTFIGNSEASATAYDKINARYQTSPQSTVNLVNDLTGLNIKYYVTVDTKALRDLVDTIGGVTFNVPIDMDYDDEGQHLAIHLKAGEQVLNGEQAEGVVRFRHNNDYSSYSRDYGDNDIGRMRTQREFIKCVLQQTMKPSNLLKINELINIATKEVETNIPWEVIKSYIPALLQFDAENIRAEMLPGSPRYINQISFYVANRTQAKQLVQELFINVDIPQETVEGEDGNVIVEPKAEKKNNSEITIEVLNGIGSTTQFNKAVTQLQNAGYRVIKKGTTNLTKKTIITNRTGIPEENEISLKSLLCTGYVQKGEDNQGVDFTIIIGADY